MHQTRDKYDKQSHAWFELGRYMTEMIIAQDRRLICKSGSLCAC